jgi:phosphatidylglycerol---prolipoprotein diacylglyceryl transferase
MHFATLFPAFAYFVDDFDPVILHLYGPLSIRWYGVAYLLGFLGGYLLWRRAVSTGRTSLSREQVEELLTWAIGGVLVGGRLGYMLLYDFGAFVHNPLILFRIYDGGMSFHGGLAGVALAVAIVGRKDKLPFWEIGDLCAMAAPVGIFFGRIANFVNGELWGKVSSASWAMIFPNAPYDSSEPTVSFDTAQVVCNANPRLPSQLYEAFFEGIVLGALMLVLYWWGRGSMTKKYPGLLSGIFLFAYAFARIFCELFREPDAALIMGLSRGTFYSSLMVVAGCAVVVGVLANAKKSRAKKPDGK